MSGHVWCKYKFAVALVFLWVAVGPLAYPSHAQSPAPQADAQAVASHPLATLNLANNHKVLFFTQAGGQVGIAETGPIGTPKILSEEVLNKKPSEIFVMLKGAKAAPPVALVNAEKRNRVLGRFTSNHVAPVTPQQGASGAGKGPNFHDAGNQQWFKDTFCTPGVECLQGWDWATSSFGYQQGRGYATDAINGSEARLPRVFNVDYWNGQNWQNFITVSVPNGYYGWAVGGNTGAPTINDTSLYYKSELLDNGSSAQVSLSDQAYPWAQVCAQRYQCDPHHNNCGYHTVCSHVAPDSGCTGYGYNCQY